ncbi:MAG: hypothetical protein ABSG68_01870 [Thermoguttaceae bacterium]|jgi:hypothetical protein
MSRKALLLAVSAVLSPVLVVFLEVQAAGAPPQKPAAAPQTAAKPLVGGERAILMALKQPTSIDCHDMRLQDLVDALQQKHGIPIVLDKKAMEDVGMGPDMPVNRSIEGISLRSALRLLLRELRLAYTIRDEAILITTAETAEQELITKSYDVSDLLSPRAQDYPYRDDELPRPPRGNGDWDDHSGRSAAQGRMYARIRYPAGASSAQDLAELITASVMPTTWDTVGGPGSIAEFDRLLVVTQNFDVHVEIEDLLARLRARRRATPTVLVDFQWLWLTAGPYQQLVGDAASADGRVPSVVDAKVLDELARKSPGFRGRIMCVNGQLVHLASGDRRSVIVNATPTVEMKAAISNNGGMSGMGGGLGAMGGGIGMSGIGMSGISGGMFYVADDPFAANATPSAKPAAKSTAEDPFADEPAPPAKPQPKKPAADPFATPPAAPPAPPAPAPVPAAPPAVNVPTAPASIPAIAGQTAYWPTINVVNVGVVVEVRPSVAPGTNTAVLDLRSSVTRWGKPAPPARLGAAGSASCPVDRPNIPAAQMAMTVRVPLGKPVLLGAVTFAPADGAGLDKATENPVQFCLIATTRIVADTAPKLVKKH